MGDKVLSGEALQGMSRLAVQHRVEKEQLETVIQRTVEVFDAHPSGMFERDLGEMLRAEGFSRSHVGAGLDVLRSRGLAVKNWTTGFLSHVSAM